MLEKIQLYVLHTVRRPVRKGIRKHQFKARRPEIPTDGDASRAAPVGIGVNGRARRIAIRIQPPGRANIHEKAKGHVRRTRQKPCITRVEGHDRIARRPHGRAIKGRGIHRAESVRLEAANGTRRWKKSVVQRGLSLRNIDGPCPEGKLGRKRTGRDRQGVIQRNLGLGVAKILAIIEQDRIEAQLNSAEPELAIQRHAHQRPRSILVLKDGGCLCQGAQIILDEDKAERHDPPHRPDPRPLPVTRG